ncbi:hypothetical protein KP509_38G050600 [Ceratopteris richardii]|uniref:Uncharacterized protein n=1 Tax=Ceratopteris richardii TaxID=49495 RepID=A0A8T2Q3R8_CERRI|nr:hypothetical protein KP509_38G050600 [Ceratopteris richardii]
MRSRPSAPIRPVGTDGTDHPFRMTVDSRYRNVASKKLQLRKLLVAQAVFHLIKAVQVVFLALNNEIPARTTIAACFFGAAAVLSGTIGLRRTSSILLHLFIFTTSGALLLSLFPILAGSSKVFMFLQGTTSYRLFVLDGLEVAQEAVVLQLFQIYVAFSLVQSISRK